MAEKLTASCHCGTVRLEIPHPPDELTSCNCSICRRYGTLWAYYPADEVRVTAGVDATDEYQCGDKRLRFLRCRHCGCVMHWERVQPKEGGKVGVNARNLAPEVIEGVRVRRLDGASTWKFLD
jgi:hypothetical protein